MNQKPLLQFNQRVKRLNRTGLADRMKNPNYVLSYDKFMNREWICADGVDEDSVDAFVLNLRLLVQDQDGFSIRCLAEAVYEEGSVPSDLHQRFDSARNKWQRHKSQICLLKHPLGEGNFSNGELFDVLMYGGLAHANAEKVELFTMLTKSGAISAFVFSGFLKSLRTFLQVVNAIREVNEELLERSSANH